MPSKTIIPNSYFFSRCHVHLYFCKCEQEFPWFNFQLKTIVLVPERNKILEKNKLGLMKKWLLQTLPKLGNFINSSFEGCSVLCHELILFSSSSALCFSCAHVCFYTVYIYIYLFRFCCHVFWESGKSIE